RLAPRASIEKLMLRPTKRYSWPVMAWLAILQGFHSKSERLRPHLARRYNGRRPFPLSRGTSRRVKEQRQVPKKPAQSMTAGPQGRLRPADSFCPQPRARGERFLQDERGSN